MLHLTRFQSLLLRYLRCSLLLVMLCLNGIWRVPVWADAIVTPDQIEATLQPGACTSHTITIATDAATTPALDVVFIIDVTGSMSGVIDEVTRSAEKITGDIFALSPDANFALVTLSDYAGGGGLLSLFTGYGGPADYPWRLDQDFTSNSVQLQQSLEAIQLMDGGDDAESYLRALYESQFLNWRAGSRRLVLLFGDSFPHDPDPGRDAEAGTSDDLTQDEVITQLAAAHITVLPIYTQSGYQDFYTAVAQGTNGRAFHLQDTAQVPQVIQTLIGEALASIRALTLAVADTDTDWFAWNPSVHADVAPAEQRDFALDICAPSNVTGGDYSFVVDVTGDGALLGQVPVLVHVKAPLNILFLLIPMAGLLFGGILYWLLSRRRPVSSGDVSRPEPRAHTPTAPRNAPRPVAPRSGASIQHGRPSAHKESKK